jgi:hypothetical protein
MLQPDSTSLNCGLIQSCQLAMGTIITLLLCRSSSGSTAVHAPRSIPFISTGRPSACTLGRAGWSSRKKPVRYCYETFRIRVLLSARSLQLQTLCGVNTTPMQPSCQRSVGVRQPLASSSCVGGRSWSAALCAGHIRRYVLQHLTPTFAIHDGTWCFQPPSIFSRTLPYDHIVRIGISRRVQVSKVWHKLFAVARC